MKKTLVVLSLLVVGAGLVSAADYFNLYFQAKQVQVIVDASVHPTLPPCLNHGGLLGPASLGHDDASLLTIFTCTDQSVILWRDMRPGSGNGSAVGTTTQDIKLHLDAPADVVGRTLINGGGWVYECGHQIISLQVTIGSTVLDYGPHDFATGPRPDVAAAYGNTCSQMGSSGVGFTADLSGLAIGSYPVQMRAADDAGHVAFSNTLMVTVR